MVGVFVLWYATIGVFSGIWQYAALFRSIGKDCNKSTMAVFHDANEMIKTSRGFGNIGLVASWTLIILFITALWPIAAFQFIADYQKSENCVRVLIYGK